MRHIRRLNRIVPVAPPRAFKTYGVHVVQRAPISCEAAACEPYLKGWVTTVLANSEDENTIEAACRGEIDGYRRRWTSADPDPQGFIRYRFEPGQPCFRASAHAIPTAVRFSLRDGDWRGNPTGRETTTDNAQTWVDDFGEHQQRIAEQRQRYGAE